MGVVDSVKDVLKVAQTIDNIELWKKLSELQTRIMELDEENGALRQENMEVKKRNEIEDRLRFEDNRYWLISDGKRDGPFCSVCWDVDQRLVREKRHTSSGREYYTCHYCGLVKRESRN